MIAAVAEGMGLGVIFDDEFLAEARVVKVPIRGPVSSSHDDLVCMSERRNSQIISGFLAITQEYIEKYDPSVNDYKPLSQPIDVSGQIKFP